MRDDAVLRRALPLGRGLGRASRDFHQILHGDRGGPGHHFRSILFWVPSIVSPLVVVENLAENAPIEVNC